VSRICWDELYMEFAHMLAKRSTCARASVGCVVVSWDYNQVLAIGYNGNYKGGPNVCDSTEPGNCGCTHSETNCLIKLDYNNPTKKRLYTTTSPCIPCAKQIINANIDVVYYDVCYRDASGLHLLNKNGVLVLRQTNDTLVPQDFGDEPIY